MLGEEHRERASAIAIQMFYVSTTDVLVFDAAGIAII
jgi:hypothetical protein